MPTILFISHPQALCGVYDFGRAVFDVLRTSRKYQFVFEECRGVEDVRAAARRLSPAAVIYNHHPATIPWLTRSTTKRFRVPQIGILHEVTQQIADGASNDLFDYFIAPDPTLLLRNPIVFKTGRLIPRYDKSLPPLSETTIGSFGFGTPGKGFEALVSRVQQEFDRAVVRLSIPYATFADADGRNARAIADRCRALVTKPGIKLDVSHDFLEKDAVLDFLAGNSLNAFFYEQQNGRGISSAIDYAMAVGRPIAITRSSMFRHIRQATPPVTSEDSTLRQILANGFAPLKRYRDEWNAENLVWDYERILGAVLKTKLGRAGGLLPASLLEMSEKAPPVVRHAAAAMGETLQVAAGSAVPFLRSAKRKIGSSNAGDRLLKTLEGHESFSTLRAFGKKVLGDAKHGGSASDWVPRRAIEDDALQEKRRAGAPPYLPIRNAARLNRILDDEARALYAPAIAYLVGQMPEVMARKIARANVQQAFVLDTVLRLARSYSDPSLLCIGSYEDTASAGVMMNGFRVEEVDPVVNYDLSTYLSRPSTKRESFQIIFSTSVIEHVTDDETFVKDMEELLAPGGVGVFTCDFNDTYKAGDPLPIEDRRFYTRRDLEVRFPTLLTRSELVDRPDWKCDAPDFSYGGIPYTFATFVFRRVR